ncbi:MAG: SusC/RagA family TonB-linked outer membrane protein [Chitinophagaceae bacterium]|nr:SusC/RagA family TonB-linked outer membrane protein [Chitinophagaceae bacterium]MCW5926965.1 SusC/RagA family TonB-linked outer membrane protein [Chitinophagaceae bacterium]
MTRRLAFLLTWTLLCCGLYAQQFTVAGRVTESQTEQPVAGASVTVKGTGTSVLTRADGSFSIQATANQILIISFVGRETVETAINKNSRNINISLAPESVQLAEIVVTGALGIKRSTREFGASAKVVDNESLNQGKTVNPIFGLTSKVTGLRINMYDSKVDPAVQITLRGTRSLSRTAGIDGRNTNAPIYVVDGIPVPEIGRLNPNDIESITVLKGANAAALYGSEGVNGALMITTKTGKRGRGVISFSNTTTFSKVFLLPPAQTKYGQGSGGEYDATQYESWGPAFDGSMKDFGLPLPDGTQPQLLYAAPARDNRLDLFQTGINIQNDVSFSGGDERSTYFLSLQNVSQTGIIPKDKNNRTNLRFNGSRNFGKLNTSYNINYIYNDKSITPDGPWIGAYRYPANFDFNMVKDWEDPLSPGNPLNYFTPSGSWLRNPYFQIDNIRDNSKQQTINGKVELDYRFTSWFKAVYRLGLYNVSEETNSYTRKFLATGTRNVPGVVTDGNNNYRRVNSDLMLNFKKDFNKISTKLLLGQNIRTDDRKQTSVGVTNSGGSGQLLYPDVINPGSRTGNLAGSVANTQYRSVAAYGEFTAGYDNYLYLTFTGRNDWVSVLSKENRSYFYPGVSASFVASDAVSFLRESRHISFAKLYASWNKTGNVPLPPYSLNNTYSQLNGFPFGNIAGFLPSSTNPNPNIQPEFVYSYEAGLQLGLFDNRLNFEGAYVYTDSKGQILAANTSRATGYSVMRVNSGQMTNSIIEASVNGDIIRSKNLRWNLGFNFTYIDNQLKELYGGATEINNFRQSYGIIGERFPSLLVSDYKRDPNGNVVVDPNTGDPIIAADNRLLGTLVPPYQMGVSTMLSYRGFSISAQFDWRMGGWLYSEIVPAMYAAGTDPRTTEYDRQPFVWPNSVIETVAPEYNPDGSIKTAGQYVPNTLTTSGGGRAFWSKQGEVQINTAAKSDFFKLRELNVTYQLPLTLLGKQNVIREASIAFIATNLFLIRHVDNKYGDPEYLYNNTDGYLSFRQVPPIRTFGFNVNVTF